MNLNGDRAWTCVCDGLKRTPIRKKKAAASHNAEDSYRKLMD